MRDEPVDPVNLRACPGSASGRGIRPRSCSPVWRPRRGEPDRPRQRKKSCSGPGQSPARGPERGLTPSLPRKSFSLSWVHLKKAPDMARTWGALGGTGREDYLPLRITHAYFFRGFIKFRATGFKGISYSVRIILNPIRIRPARN